MSGLNLLARLLLASGLVKSGEELVAYHALQGVAIFNHLASFVSLVTQSIPSGRARNVAFSCLGPSQLLGFLGGLVLGGVLVDAVGWRVGFFYLTGGLSRLLSEWASSVSRRGQYCSLFFQEVQGFQSATEASTQLLPSLVIGMILNFITGLFVHKVSARGLVAGSSIVCAGGPPISGDILITVGLIIVPEAFPEDTQTLAGAVYNAASQFGTCLGLAIMQVVAGVVTKKAAAREAPIDALLGYRASFWVMSGFMVLCFALGLVGLHQTGKLGNKKEN